MRRIIIFIAALVVSILSFNGLCSSGGLAFPGNERRFSERSSLRLFTNGTEPGPVDSLSVEFEYTPLNIKSLGYIFFLKNADGPEAFNLTYTIRDDVGFVSFAQDGRQMLTSAGFPVDDFPNGLPVVLKLYMEADSASVTVGDKTEGLGNIGLTGNKFAPRFFFGMCDHIIETASFAINSLKISLNGRRYEFPLDESNGSEVHSADGRVMGEVVNPIWLINRSYYWDHIFTTSLSTPAGCVFADERDQFLIYSRDSLLNFNLRDRVVVKKPYMADDGWFTRLGMGFFNPGRNSIFAYELNYKRTVVGEIEIENRHCRVLDKGSVDLQMHHHSAVYLDGEDKMLMSGGYGNRRYYNDFIQYDITNSRWDTLRFSGDVIPPRFFAAMGVAPDGKSLYVYGGKGNSSGNQDVGVVYYYDLYKVDLQTRKVSKLWEQPAPETKRVPTRRLIVSPDNEYLYVMAYPEYHPHSVLRLYKMSIADGSCEELADSIPIVSEEIATNAALYYSKSLDKFYCVVQEYSVVREPDECCENTVNIYSLKAPAVSLAAVRRYDKSGSSAMLVVVGLILVLSGVAVWWWFGRRRNRTSRTVTHATDYVGGIASDSVSDDVADSAGDSGQTCVTWSISVCDEDVSPEDYDDDIRIVGPPRRNSLQLFGLFTAFDRNGRDISYLFSSKIRQIFVYLLLNSVSKEGVMSPDLSCIFWPDKPEDRIKNLKNVTMSKLRKVLQEFDGVELVYRKGYFKVEMTDEFYCDYVSLFRLSDGFSVSDEMENVSSDMLDIIARGKFMTGLEQQIFDYYRQQVEKFTIEVLSDRIRQCYQRGENSATLLACNVLSVADPLSELAMRYAVKVNMRKNRKEKALTVYRLFVKEYQKTMGEKYGLSFSQVAE